MSKHKGKQNKKSGQDLRLNPEARLVPRFDETSIAEFTVARPGKMGVRVVDNCAEEHMM